MEKAFGGEAPLWTGPPESGYCSHCNEVKDIRIRQWFLCGVCARVLASIGRGIVAAKYVLSVWDNAIAERMPGITFVETDAPGLRRRLKDAAEVAPRADFTAFGAKEPVFGIELKSGPGAAGIGGIGAPMSEFQLDVSDCDAITSVTRQLEVPLFVCHVQVRNRPVPPTLQFVPTGMWWVSTRNMGENLRDVRNRPRETRPAAYFRTAMFRPISTFPDEVDETYLATEKARIRSGDVPVLYHLPATDSG